MIIALDVGNTNIVAGIFDGKKFIDHMRLATGNSRTSDEYGMFFAHLLDKTGTTKGDIDGVIISSVVPGVVFSLKHAVEKYIDVTPLIVNCEMDTGIMWKIDNPHELGSDAISNAVAASNKYKGNIIVVDFGTATTFFALTEDKAFLGGAIAAGIRVALAALSDSAAKLPWIHLDAPEKTINTGTVACMQAGSVYGYAGLVDGIVKRMKKELGGRAKVVATGGLSSVVTPYTDSIDLVDKGLTLDGLRILYERNA